ncbi:hypothetical protein HPB52_021653 [Rhipicephalus sanguineus]|uniref:Uncharacterized protein n=1 Tax=Rhipicephalus sanguineus TaxID=34632 RepID=A0A9D4Q3X5_RHISA|nr:hypothetical protein HPB52_021653 [Rhipicephalus sanguineus]
MIPRTPGEEYEYVIDLRGDDGHSLEPLETLMCVQVKTGPDFMGTSPAAPSHVEAASKEEVEALFSLYRIASETTRYYHVASVLPPDVASELSDSSPYQHLKIKNASAYSSSLQRGTLATGAPPNYCAECDSYLGNTTSLLTQRCFVEEAEANNATKEFINYGSKLINSNSIVGVRVWKSTDFQKPKTRYYLTW